MSQTPLKNNPGIISRISTFLVFGVMATLALALENINSFFIILLFVFALIRGHIPTMMKNAWSEHFFRSCALLFLIIAAGYFYTTASHNGLSKIEKSLILPVIPFILCSKVFAWELKWKQLSFFLLIALFIISFYCLAISFIKFLGSRDIQDLFYYAIVSPLSLHPVYLSALLLISIFSIMEGETILLTKYRYLRYSIVAFFVIMVILLSSKLMLILLTIYLLYKIFRTRVRKVKWYISAMILLAIAALIIFTKNPIKDRFQNAMSLDMEKFTSQDLSHAYFNGVEFRLIQWKLVFDALTVKKSWLLGVSPGDAQTVLNDQYRKYHFYQGEAHRHDKGYLDYNVHNQFLQCLFQSGLLGFLAFLYICYSMIRLAIRKQSLELTMTVVVLIAFSFTESVLQTQKGLVTFTLFPLLMYFNNPGPKVS